MKFASLGTVSHATCNPADLIPAFLAELEWQLSRQERIPGTDECAELDKVRGKMEELNDEVFDDEGEYVEREDDGEILAELFDLLETFSPPYCYFGSTEGDGSDYGYWFSHDSIEDLQRFSDLSEVDEDAIRELGEDYCVVNDHGNVTVYNWEGKEIIAVV